nr:hypothetical protein [Methylomarinum sp. Ch1-1]MDP4521216.1 hypothetical protein [Methylomarinum sp. Ch1-1]
MMTIGVVLSVPDSEKIRQAEFKKYKEIRLDHPVFSPINKALIDGLDQGVFDLQLHGMAHYWPDNLMRALVSDEQIRHWLDQDKFPQTETLPSVLQSRWVNAEQLPTSPLSQDEIDKAVDEEVGFFKQLFGFYPKVAVPPTFVWDLSVERSWKRHNIEYLVTPGQCFNGRDKEGKPNGARQKIVNGQLSDSGLIYMVRNDYFEPSLGHTSDMAINTLMKNTELGQPTLLETHRFNFIQDDDATKNAIAELEKVISGALAKYPELMFLSTHELADKLASKNENFIERSFGARLFVCMDRLWANQSIKKWLYISGLFVPLLLFLNVRKKTWNQRMY